MKKCKKQIVLLLVVLFIISIFSSGCVVSQSRSSDNADDTKSTDTSSTTSIDAPIDKPPTKVTMFFGDAGIAFPTEVDVSNNPFLNLIEEAANVDLEMIQPSYADFQTKFNLTMASGNIPDIVHCWFHADINKYGVEGAFCDWEELISTSPTLKKYYTEDMLDMMRADNGKIYGLYTLSNGNPTGTYARIDLIREVYGDKSPVTPDEWFEVMSLVKEKYPDSVPLSSRGGFMMMDMFFKAFGSQVDGNGVKMQTTDDNRYIWAFEYPQTRDAIMYHRKLYENGLLDTTFVTNTPTDLENRINEKNMMVWRGDSAAVLNRQQEFAKLGNTKAIVGFVNNPIAPGIDPKLAYWAGSPLGWHILSVSSEAQNKDAVLRVIEAFLDPEISEKISWGREGIEHFTRQDGTRLVDAQASADTYYRNAYLFMRQYWYAESMNVRMATVLPKMDSDQAAEFSKVWKSGIEIRDRESAMVPQITDASFVPTIADFVPKSAEAKEESKNIMYRAVMGEISMEDYDSMVKEWLDKYKYITDAYTEELQRVARERGQ
jgi:ABC-type glycerol-3-phosphate transport system substrate-binding protein